MSEITEILAIATGAVAGGLSRFHLTEWTKTKFGSKFPYGTFLINVTGCVAIGFFFTLSRGITGYPPEIDLLVRIGFLGSYTTFSTYAFETLILWRNREIIPTLFYSVGSVILGLIAVTIGMLLARFFGATN